MNLKTLLSAIFLLSALALSQKCLNHAGKEVNWFVILRTPGVKNPSYHYYDNNTRDSFAFYTSSPDQPNHPIYNTFTSLSKSDNQIIAWNDQIPNGSSSHTKAHSKTVIGYSLASNTGIVVVHSFPNYPTIIEHTINPTILINQSIYGQHFLCFKSGVATKEILAKTSLINPNHYGNKSKINFSMASNRNISFIQSYLNSQIWMLALAA